MNKTANSQLSITRQQIGNWIHAVLTDISPSFKIEQLGKGVIYCRLLNHYFPGTILINRIIWTPKSEYQNMLNLKVAQNAMIQLKINIPIDPIRLSKEKLSDNWAFIYALYKYLNLNYEESAMQITSVQEKNPFHYYPQIIQTTPTMFTPKRTIQHLYPDPFYQGLGRPLFFQVDQNIQQSNYYNASKYSVGKIQGGNIHIGNSSPNKGKWSVNSHLFQNNLAPIIDRVKEILLKPFNNTQKIRQIKILLNIPLNQQVIVKVQQDQSTQIIVANSKAPELKVSNQAKNTNKQDKKELSLQSSIQNKQELKLLQFNQ